ncbi:MAG: hypothetical protein K8I00_00930 [Candidatus Omnitrophica bacterium]|nr:hypothetical protein [Candidatus Omnitrophota bacterium]
MNPLKIIYKALIPEGIRIRIWTALRGFPARWRLLTQTLRYRASRKTFHRRATILFYPERPRISAFAIIKICRLSGHRISTDPSQPYDLAIYWEDVTWRKPDAVLNAIEQRGRCINGACVDISKKHVQNIFQEVFGYPLAVEPLTAQGDCVKKSNINFKHDGQVIRCPVSAIEPDYVYQKLINNRRADNLVEEIRVPIFADRIPFVCLKYRHVNDRFQNYFRATIKPSVDIFSANEISLIQRFCARLKLDYGELDILRDNDDGRIYIVDANTTPSGPPRHLPAREEWQAVRLMAETFADVFLNKDGNWKHRADCG